MQQTGFVEEHPDKIRAHLLDVLLQNIDAGIFNERPADLIVYARAMSEFVDVLLEHVER